MQNSTSDAPNSRAGSLRTRLKGLRSRARGGLVFLAGIAAALIGLLLYNAAFPPPKPLTQRQVNDTVAQAMSSATPPPARAALIHQAIMPSFVLIQTDDPTSAEATPDPTATDSTDPQKKSGHSLGSGVVVSDKGDILTSLHVVADATAIKVT